MKVKENGKLLTSNWQYKIVKECGNQEEMVDTVTLSGKPEIYANNESDMEILNGCYHG